MSMRLARLVRQDLSNLPSRIHSSIVARQGDREGRRVRWDRDAFPRNATTQYYNLFKREVQLFEHHVLRSRGKYERAVPSTTMYPGATLPAEAYKEDAILGMKEKLFLLLRVTRTRNQFDTLTVHYCHNTAVQVGIVADQLSPQGIGLACSLFGDVLKACSNSEEPSQQRCADMFEAVRALCLVLLHRLRREEGALVNRLSVSTCMHLLELMHLTRVSDEQVRSRLYVRMGSATALKGLDIDTMQGVLTLHFYSGDVPLGLIEDMLSAHEMWQEGVQLPLPYMEILWLCMRCGVSVPDDLQIHAERQLRGLAVHSKIPFHLAAGTTTAQSLLMLTQVVHHYRMGSREVCRLPPPPPTMHTYR